MQFGVLLLLFFFGGDESYKSHSPIIKEETIDAISSFLQRGCEELGIKRVSIYFHGGEPLLMKHHLFEYACLSFKNKLEKILDSLLLSVQTNALLVNKEWVGLFEKYSIRVGVSIDGFKEHHDKFRIDHKGRGSYDKTVEKIKYLQGFEKQGRIDKVGCLSVVNKKYNGGLVYKHLVHSLGFNGVDFLLPDYTHETFKEDSRDYGRFLCEVFNAWVQDNNPAIDVRCLTSTVRILLGFDSARLDFLPDYTKFASITISSDGDLSPDDTLMSTCAPFLRTGKTVTNTSLKQYLTDPIFDYQVSASLVLPDKCRECGWQNICRGGQAVHRYSHKNYFNNPSIMCEGLQMLYTRVTQYLVDNSVPYAFIQKRLIEGIN
jgi:uncharacterized protein